MRKIFTLLALTLVLVLLMPACAKPATSPITPSAPLPPTATTKPAAPTAPPQQPAPQYGGTWKIILTGAVANIGQLGAQTEVTGGMYPRVSRPAMETLWNYDNSEKIVPKLAESFDVSPDAKVLNIRLRKGVKFHDGTPWNAQALSDNLQLIKDSTANPALAASLYALVTNWEVVDEYTLRVNFKTYDSKFMTTLAERGMVSPTAAKKPTTPENMAKDHMIGTGPFKFVSYQRAQFIKYTVKNDSYWQSGKPYLDGLEINEIADSVTAILSFKKGEGQTLFSVSPKDTADLKASGFEVIRGGTNAVNYIIPSGASSDSVWSNLKVRQAAEYAIDKTSLAKLGIGYWEPVTQFAVPSDARYVQGLTPRNYDPAKAKQLLTEAGYPGGIKSTIIADTGYNREILVALQTYLKEAGIDCALDIQDPAKATENRTKGWKDGILCVGVPLLGPLQSFYTSIGPGMYPSMFRGTFQQKMDAAIAEPNYDKRMGIIKEMVKLMYDDVMAIPLYAAPSLCAMDTKIIKGDIGWMVGHPNFFEPQNAWLSK